MSRFIFHIGLPKTATTALQRHYFEVALGEDVNYLGVLQPRERCQTPEYKALMEALCCLDSDAHQAIVKCERLLSRLRDAETYIFSEEMITVDTDVTWQEKLVRLGEIGKGLDFSILVTLREPLDAAFSLYVEQWHSLHMKYSTFDEFFGSNQGQLFDYKYLLGLMESVFGRDAIKLIPFELVKQDRKFLAAFERAIGVQVGLTRLPNENAKRKDSHGAFVRPLSAMDIINREINTRRSRTLCYAMRVGRRLLSPIHPALKRIDCPWSEKLVPFPDFGRYRSELRPSNDWLFENYQIRY